MIAPADTHRLVEGRVEIDRRPVRPGIVEFDVVVHAEHLDDRLRGCLAGKRLPLPERCREKGERLLDGRPHGSGNPLQQQEGQTEKKKHQENPVQRNFLTGGQGCPMR